MKSLVRDYVWMAFLGLVLLAILTACGNVSGRELPMVYKSDPIWPLPLDHLE